MKKLLCTWTSCDFKGHLHKVFMKLELKSYLVELRIFIEENNCSKYFMLNSDWIYSQLTLSDKENKKVLK